MEKIRDSIQKKLPPLRLFFDDVRELHGFICSIAENVTLEAEDYRLTSPEELKKLNVRQIHNFTIRAERPYIRVQLTNASATIYLGNADINAEGIAVRIEEILHKGKAKVYFLPVGFLSGMIISIPLWIGIFMKSITIAGIGLALPLAYFILMQIDLKFRFEQYSTILSLERNEETSFWNRNKDQITLLVIGSILGSGVTLLIKWIAGLF